jgi:hypothetical protein
MPDPASDRRILQIVLGFSAVFVLGATLMIRDCMSYPRQAQLRFPARVVESAGQSLAPGTACLLIAQAHGNGRQSFIDGVELRCGATSLPLAETFGACAPQEQAEPGSPSLRYRLTCRISEQLPKRHLPQQRPGFVVDTPRGQLQITSTAPGPSSIRLSIAEHSEPVSTPRLLD